MIITYYMESSLSIIIMSVLCACSICVSWQSIALVAPDSRTMVSSWLRNSNDIVYNYVTATVMSLCCSLMVASVTYLDFQPSQDCPPVASSTAVLSLRRHQFHSHSRGAPPTPAGTSYRRLITITVHSCGAQAPRTVLHVSHILLTGIVDT